ncbi:Predicted transcriptional regulator [Candidatus Desulfosporosinus infrequens]|uniref:Predicted transcriptional regulator n=1 Tax=Candidatus Desulfosporosinus infrequens TaxID=2043169 RepID=A0A2U3LTN2_9FIRM|nr:Predicted transcriptional regulator [Candidatus Desulfosporosinus infrequens]
MDNSGDNGNPEREQFIKQFDAGQYLKQLRGDRSLASICKLIKVTPAHLSEIERGRMPSDHLISTFAKVYEVEEDGLFRRWGKIPILTKDEILARKSLQRILTDISHNRRLTDEEKDGLYDNMYELYRSFIEQKNQEEGI